MPDVPLPPGATSVVSPPSSDASCGFLDVQCVCVVIPAALAISLVARKVLGQWRDQVLQAVPGKRAILLFQGVYY